jgi:hypothetical protein
MEVVNLFLFSRGLQLCGRGKNEEDTRREILIRREGTDDPSLDFLCNLHPLHKLLNSSRNTSGPDTQTDNKDNETSHQNTVKSSADLAQILKLMNG